MKSNCFQLIIFIISMLVTTHMSMIFWVGLNTIFKTKNWHPFLFQHATKCQKGLPYWFHDWKKLVDVFDWCNFCINFPNVFYFQVELVEPPKSAQVGERVTFPGFEGQPDDVLNPKKKVWETLQVDLHTNADLVACYKDIPLTTSAGVCTVSTISEGSIK